MLVANDDPRAPAVLREAYLLLQQQADKIDEPVWRASFLQNIQTHQALVEEYHGLRLAPASAHSLDDQPLTRHARENR